ncbi:uncharacterized protein LOC132608090 [Lycium barbarum]|uniref:uncharacterized protein LOC132608090 n=1 Tax=Lycium barbarum TaxID=112863 RepID=UPI00293EA616|nr:uncharacterized protein LOC132608090 [Lycium barbarum]
MEKIEKVDFRVKEYLEDAGREKWAQLYSPVEPSTEYVYTVNDKARRFIIDLKKKTCSCWMFQMDEIPCPHAWAVLKSKSLMPDEYCSDLFKPKTVIKTYDVPVDPLPDESEWNIPKNICDEFVLPPRYKRPLGRSKKKRDKPLIETMIGNVRMLVVLVDVLVTIDVLVLMSHCSKCKSIPVHLE